MRAHHQQMLPQQLRDVVGRKIKGGRCRLFRLGFPLHPQALAASSRSFVKRDRRLRHGNDAAFHNSSARIDHGLGIQLVAFDPVPHMVGRRQTIALAGIAARTGQHEIESLRRVVARKRQKVIDVHL